MKTFRTMETWATRDNNSWKLEYQNYINPLCDYSFAQYMKWKQIIWWEYRRGDNRQKWLWKESLFESLVRHIEVLKLLYKWYRVFEVKKDWVADLIVLEKNTIFDEKSFDFCEEKNIITECNAIRFNSEALKLDILSDNYMLWIKNNKTNS